jgi:hypothetical protein
MLAAPPDAGVVTASTQASAQGVDRMDSGAPLPLGSDISHAGTDDRSHGGCAVFPAERQAAQRFRLLAAVVTLTLALVWRTRRRQQR